MKTTILLVAPRGFSPKRHYRGEGVMEQLSKIDPEIKITYPVSDELWKDIIKADIVYMFHATEQAHVECLKQARNMDVPVWVDYDDDLFNVPKENPAYAGIKANQENFKFILDSADLISCNTNPLGQVIGAYTKRSAMVIPNALDDYIFNDWTFPEPDKDCMNWRGGVSHQLDLLDYAEEFWKFLEQTEDKVYLNFMGYYPYWIEKGFSWRPAKFKNRTEFYPYIFNHYEFLNTIKYQVKPWAQVVPLMDNDFNRSKSNIAAIEAAYCGIIPIVPDWEGWREFPGSEVYQAPKDLAACMKDVMQMNQNENLRKAAQKSNAEHVRQNYLLSKVNLRRIEAIKALMAMKG